MGNDFRRAILYVSLLISAILLPIHAFEASTFSDQNNLRVTLCNGNITKDCTLNVNGDNQLPKPLLQGGPASGHHICYGAVQRPPVCNGNIYGNCIAPVGPYYRPCTYYDRCKRGFR
ncbi:hypothetical protein DITRI_Ditri13aG0154000 [Diplodiscus trichospermus]